MGTQTLYKLLQSAVQVNGNLTDWFTTTLKGTTGLGAITPTLQYPSLNGNALRHPCIRANFQGRQMNNLRFADDIVIMTESANDLQVLVDRVQDSSCNLGLKINITKTEVQATSKQKIDLCITVNGT